ncbi:ABC-2 family transporter protein [Archangium violaceum]|uniref:ABC transporter permease n=1 Tax=Archangium violaceum TaxID=83451 RepID=UPI00193B5AA9|nr:ABC-2 family transporter protein [Archangium violaceum]QRK08647.1 ABC-2 family transporter protein [Archangium violaceum]
MFTRLAHWMWIYYRLQVLHLRVQLEYEADFWLGIIAMVLRHVTGFIFLWAVFRHVPQVQGWTQWEMLFLYALAIIPIGLVELFYDGPWELAALVNQGELDGLLLRPMPAALQVICQGSSLHGLGSVVLGLVLLGRAVSELNLALSPWQYVFLVASMVGATLLIGSLNFMAHCVVFWEPDTSMQLPVLVQEMATIARYPLSLYDRLLRLVTTWVLPFAFVSYFPGTVLLHRPEANPWLGYGAPLVGVAVTCVAGAVWTRCLAHYQGVGS